MTNLELAAVFNRIAELLEVQDENPFKIRAYRKVAQVLETLNKEASGIHDRGGLGALQALPGVGKAIAQKIEELLQTGKLRFYEELKKSVPQGLVSLVSIPEVGPKTAKLIPLTRSKKNCRTKGCARRSRMPVCTVR